MANAFATYESARLHSEGARQTPIPPLAPYSSQLAAPPAMPKLTLPTKRR